MVTPEIKENSPSKNAYIVLDMDGTLYMLDGEDQGFKGSSLQKQVAKNILNFIIKMENVSMPEAQQLLDEFNSVGEMHSIYLSNRYGISRQDYFNMIWNIAPDKIIDSKIDIKYIFETLIAQGQHLILVTSAPKIWQQNVCNYLGVGHLLSEVYTGESFIQKDEIFSLLAQKYPPESTTSVGDQYLTDIKPAEKLGMSVLLVTNPQDLVKLIQDEED